MLRVIAGNYKGRKLVTPDDITRPVTDRIKTTVFDLLREFIPNARVLDLYAGSGAFGIEALSRGAQHCTFVDGWDEAVKCINQNLQTLGIGADASKVLALNLPAGFAAQQFRSALPVDVVFCDPPFTDPKTFNILQYDSVIKHAGIFMLRLPAEYVLPEIPFEIAHKETIGVSQLVFLRSNSK